MKFVGNPTLPVDAHIRETIVSRQCQGNDATVSLSNYKRGKKKEKKKNRLYEQVTKNKREREMFGGKKEKKN